MITENVKNLFSFIDYLNSNKAYLLSKEDLIDETNKLFQKRNSIRPNENYKSKIEYDNIQLEIAKKFDIVEAEIINPLKGKISELNIADISAPIINLNAQSELFELQRNFEEDDLRLIFEAKQKYLDFRNETNFDYYLQFFFFELDRTLKEFYDFFSDNDLNEFSKLQTKDVTVESLDEQGIEKAVRKLTGYSNKLNFETFPEFLDYLKKEVKDLEFDERHSEVKRILEQQKIKLENSTFQSEIDEVKLLSEKAVKDFKQKLMLSFTNENYQTKTIGLMPIHYNYAIGLIEYEKLYNSAKNKSDDISLPPQPIKTKADILKEQLSQYGFFELEKVKTLSEQSKVSIIEKIAESGLPYAIAMFDYLQYIPYLEKKHFDSKYKLNREVSKWFDSDKEGRAVKGNISSLLKNTTENKDRYTAYKHEENVKKDYEQLK